MSYNPRKAAQVIAYFVTKTAENILPVIKVIKLVYLADRESLKRYNFPILDEDRVSMQHGPVNSTTYDYIQGNKRDLGGWEEYLESRENHQIRALSDSDNEEWDELSEADIECLNHVWDKFGNMDKWTIRDWTHNTQNIPEWENPNGGSLPIPIERILRCVGVKNYTEIASEINSFKEQDKFFDNLSTS